MTIEEIINSFPEPFKTAAKQPRFSFDYTLKQGMNDHEWLDKHGYESHMGNDCSYYVNGLSGLSPTSYGDWGSVFVGTFTDDKEDGYDKTFVVFCRMYEEGIISLWRISIYIDRIHYVYNKESNRWTKYEGMSWGNCENPMA